MDVFTPYNPLGLKNRAVMAPMTRYSCTQEGLPTQAMHEYYVKRAEGEVGLIIVESSAINDEDAMGYLGGAQFHKDIHRDAWRPIVADVQKTGAKIWLQLFHAGRLTVKAVSKVEPLAPSEVISYTGASFWRPEKEGKIMHFQTDTPYEQPKAMDKEDIDRVIKQFARSCQLAEEAGFDGVELHGAHGYLLHEFCHGECNVRKDEYEAGEFRFIKELVTACRAAVSADFVLAYRLSIHMVDSNYVRYDKELFDHGKLVEVLDELGIDVFHSSELNAGSKMFGGEEALSALIRKHTDKPLIICGRFRKQSQADKVLKSKHADLIAFGRSLISNPDLISGFRREDFEFVKFDYEKHISDIV